MKKIYLLYLLLGAFATDKLPAQTVSSSCSASVNVTQLYATDAQRLAERRIYSDSSSYRDTTTIPGQWTDTSLRALIAVYNAVSLPARDIVVNQYPIHTYYMPNTRELWLDADSSLPWMRQLRLGNLNTGNPQVDSLITTYHLKTGTYDHLGFTYYDNIIFNTDTNYNIQAIGNIFTSITGVVDAFPNLVTGSGNDITDSVTSNFVQLKYTLGWGDCEAFCINTHYWLFRVYYDCSVEYLGSWGDSITIPPTVTATEEIKNEKAFLVFPNPANGKFILKAEQNDEAMITNVLGEIVWQKKLKNQDQAEVELLQPGIYWVTVKSKSGIATKSVVVY